MTFDKFVSSKKIVAAFNYVHIANKDTSQFNQGSLVHSVYVANTQISMILVSADEHQLVAIITYASLKCVATMYNSYT